MSLLQAAACRIPVIGTNVGGIPEIVRNRTNGYLIPPKSPQAIADAVIDLLQDAGRARLMGEAGREFVESKYSIAAMVAGNLDVYYALMMQK